MKTVNKSEVGKAATFHYCRREGDIRIPHNRYGGGYFLLQWISEMPEFIDTGDTVTVPRIEYDRIKRRLKELERLVSGQVVVGAV